MADLTKLESKLGEVTGLAMAAQAATAKVMTLAKEESDELVSRLERMREEAAETEERCTTVAGSFEGKKTAILEEARATKNKASEMMSTYLDKDADALDGFEFLTMAEAGEVGHWAVLKTMSERAADADLRELSSWALPIQEGHLNGVREACVMLAGEENPSDPA
jgi:hypothetical protein